MKRDSSYSRYLPYSAYSRGERALILGLTLFGALVVTLFIHSLPYR